MSTRTHLIRGAHVLSLDPAIGDLERGDILVRDGEIVEVAHRIDAPDAEVIDGANRLAMPGFVDTHWHLWFVLFRGIIDDQPTTSWFPTKARLGPFVAAAHQAAAAELSLVEALSTGITTVHNWAHNINTVADAEANIGARARVPARMHFSFGTPSTHPGLRPRDAAAVMEHGSGKRLDEPMDIGEVARLRERSSDALLTFGVGLRGPARSTEETWRHEFADAREHALPIAMHCAGTPDEVEWIRQIEVLAAADALGPDLLLAHCNLINANERELLAASGVHVSMNPLNEVRYALAAPQLSELLAAGVSASFSIDSTAVIPASPFETMRTAYGLDRVRTGSSVPARTLIELATLGGARGLGLDAHLGSLTPGKRADLLLIRMDRPSMVGNGDPAERVVHNAQSSDVELVMVDGRVVKRDGDLVGIDVERIVANAAAAQADVLERAGRSGDEIAKLVATVAH
jgi:5-methylthioadenosine/S-adenosylhomocysteine deaminase